MQVSYMVNSFGSVWYTTFPEDDDRLPCVCG